MKGIAFGLLLAAPLWLVIGLVAYAIARAVGVLA